MSDESRDDVRRDLPSDGPVYVEGLLTGGDPRSVRNVDIVIDAASLQPERLEELVECVCSADEIARMRASDALEKVCRVHVRLQAGACGPGARRLHEAGVRERGLA